MTQLVSAHACVSCCASGWGPTHCLLCWACAPGSPRPSACACGATCMLFMMRGTFGCPAMQCVRERHPALFSFANNTSSCSCGSMTLWGLHTTSWSVLMCLVPLRMLLMMLHQFHLHQPWRLDRCNSFIHSCLPLSHPLALTLSSTLQYNPHPLTFNHATHRELAQLRHQHGESHTVQSQIRILGHGAGWHVHRGCSGGSLAGAPVGIPAAAQACSAAESGLPAPRAEVGLAGHHLLTPVHWHTPLNPLHSTTAGCQHTLARTAGAFATRYLSNGDSQGCSPYVGLQQAVLQYARRRETCVSIASRASTSRFAQMLHFSCWGPACKGLLGHANH